MVREELRNATYVTFKRDYHDACGCANPCPRFDPEMAPII